MRSLQTLGSLGESFTIYLHELLASLMSLIGIFVVINVVAGIDAMLGLFV